MAQWRQIANIPQPVANAGCVWHGGKVYVFGGDKFDGTVSTGPYNGTQVYDPETNTWSTAAGPSSDFAVRAVVSDGTYVWAVSGFKIWRYDPAANTWASFAAPMSGPAIDPWLDAQGRIMVVSGIVDSSMVAVNRYDPAANAWTTLPQQKGWQIAGGFSSPPVVGSDGCVYAARNDVATMFRVDRATAAVLESLKYDQVDPNIPFAVPIAWDARRKRILILPHANFDSAHGNLMTSIAGYDPVTRAWQQNIVEPFPPAGNKGQAIAWSPYGDVFQITGRTYANNNATEPRGWQLFGNRAPNAPVLSAPVGDMAIDRAAANRFSWVFSDPDTGDSQSAYSVRYRATGTSTWTTVATTGSPNAWWDAPAGTFAAGDYEWQAQTTDSQGFVGAWSGSEYFTAGDTPPGPSISDPINGQTIPTATYTVTWSAPDQTAYQLRRVADDGAGAPDTATVYWDTGQIDTTQARAADVAFPTNGQTEHLQLRVLSDGLWSPWASVRLVVDYTEPAAPVVDVFEDDASGSLLLVVTNPAPTGAQPAVSHNTVEVDDGTGWETRVGDLPTNASWRYWTPIGGLDYTGRLRVTAVGTNGTASTTTA